tara:strand:- start:294 stop:2741 length:2448 start_codon:yes stop_codon:yes gene_type:complete
MSKFIDCINRTTLSAKQKSAIIDDYSTRLKFHKANGSDAVKAELDAAEEMFDSIVQKNVEGRGAYLYNIKTAARHEEAIQKLDGTDLSEYSINVVERAYTLGTNAILDALTAPLADMVGMARTRIIGTAPATFNKYIPFYDSQKKMEEIVRATFDDTIGGMSGDVAKGIQRSNDMSLNMMAEAGITIQRDPLYRLPQHHLIERMSGRRKEWIEMHNQPGFLDWDNMKDFTEGRPIPTTVKDKADLLGDVFDTIVTNGKIKRKKTGVSVSSIASKYAHRRFIRYANADAWLQAHQKYGENDILGTVLGHLRSVSMDIALAREFGNQPANMIQNIAQITEQRASDLDLKLRERKQRKGRLRVKTEKNNKAAKEMHQIASYQQKAESRGFFAGAIHAGINIQAAGKLGYTSIPAVLSDSSLRHIVRREMGAGAAPEIVRFAAGLTRKEQKIQAIRLAAGVHTLAAQTMAIERHMGEVIGPLRGFAESTIRFTQLGNLTTAGRQAFSLDTFGQFGDFAKTKFADLPEPMKTWLTRYDITSKEWDVFRATKKTSDTAGGLIAPISMLDRTDIPYSEAFRLYEKFSFAVNAEMERAIPSVTLRARQAKGEYIREDTVVGALTRTYGQFKAWPVTMYYLHLRNAWRRGGIVPRVSYLAKFGIPLTISGAISIQIINILQGNDPEKMDNIDFWERATLKGGAGAIWADVLASGTDIINGPVMGFFEDSVRLVKLGYKTVTSGHDEGFLGEFLLYLKENAPVANAWQVDRILDGILQNIIEIFDPVAYNKIRRRERRKLKRRKLTPYWRFGELEPDRAPEFDLY